MQTIKELINKIRYGVDETERKKYVFYYFDRIKNKLMMLKYSGIIRIEGNFVIIEKDGREVNIPLHRFKRVTKDSGIVWNRKE